MGIENQNVCRYHKFGYCKFKTSCKFKHVTVVCDDDRCNNQNACQKRHPRVCKYFINFGSCKLGSACAYAHQTRRKVENERLGQKLDELMRIINEKDEVIKNLSNKIDDLIQKNQEKDNKIDKLVNEVKKLKDTASQANLASEDKNVTLEEKDETECVPNNDDTVEMKAKEFITKNLKHLDEMKKEVKKSRKNGKDVRGKIMTVYRRMKEEVKNCELDPKSYVRHFNCSFTVDEFETQIEKVDPNDRDESLEVIEEFITEFENELNKV